MIELTPLELLAVCAAAAFVGCVILIVISCCVTSGRISDREEQDRWN